MGQLQDIESLEKVEIPDFDIAEWHEFSQEQGWSDGMPLVPPTEAAVAKFLDAVRGDNGGFKPLSPRFVSPTLESAAANAVMAGCKPEYFPVVLAALRAVSDPQFNQHGTMATTHPCAPCILVSGPITRELSINGGTNCFGQGSRANATIGRALALILRNVGGGIPGDTDRSTQGNPGKYSLCFAENEDACPWEPYRVRRRFSREDNIVTMFSTESPHNINDHGSTSGDALITTIAGTMSQSGSNTMYGDGPTLVVIGPEHAATLHEDGWTIESIQDAIYDRGWIPADKISDENKVYFATYHRHPGPRGYSVAPSPRDIQIVVAGGPGKHSAWLPSFGATVPICERIMKPTGV